LRQPAPPIEREIRVAAPPAVVFAFFTDPALLARWMGASPTLDARAGGAIRVEFPREGSTDIMRGVFLEIEPPRRIVFSWGFEGNPALPPGTSTVEVTLEPDGGGTRVRLVHRDLPEPDRTQHDGGWEFFLGRLAEVAR
jgi:uncharacterized protein YndB with AHSA1/START domain